MRESHAHCESALACHMHIYVCCQRESLFLGGWDECTQRSHVEWGVSQQQTVRNTLLQRGGPSPPEHTQSHASDTSKKRKSTGTCGGITFSAEISLSSNTERDPARHHIRRGGKKRTTQRKVSFHKMPSVPFRRLPWLWIQFHVHNIQMQLCSC